MNAKKMKISNKGIDLITKFEGCQLKAYKCPAGVWTIGYGHTENVKKGDTLASEQEARELLLKDMKKYEDYVNKAVADKSIRFPLNQMQFDALTSFVYNCGYGNLLQLVRGRNAQTVAKKMLLYDKGGGKVLSGLTRRRKAEQKLFLS